MRDVTTLGTHELPELYQGLGDRVSVVKLPKPSFPLHFPAFLPHNSTPEFMLLDCSLSFSPHTEQPFITVFKL